MLALAVVLAPAAALRAPITHLKQGPRRALRRAAAAGPPASRAEDLVANAGDLRLFTPLGPRKPAAPLDGDALAANALSGFAVSLAMIPEAVAFAFVAGVSPIVGLQTTAVLGFVAAAFGGRGGMTSGASGACAVVVAGLVREHGAGYLPGCVVLAGFAQTFLGLVGAGKFIRMVPHPVMLGFVNGLAVVMLSAQLTHFRAPLALGLRSPEFLTMAGLTAATMALVTVVPRVTRRVPPSLAAVAAVTLATRLLHLPATTLVDLAGPAAFAGGVGVLPALSPTFAVLALAPWSFLCTVAPYAVTMAVVGIVESLLTMQLVDGLADDGTRGSTRQECVGQGLGNLASGLLGGQGGCALIGQSLINVQSGGTSRLSGMAMAAFLALGLVFGAPLLGGVPVASLVGVMLLVCRSTFAWSSLRLWGKVPRVDLFVVALVSLVTVCRDLAQAVGAGVVVSALAFAWEQSKRIRADAVVGGDGRKTYALRGPLFFGSSTAFRELFAPSDDPTDVVLDFSGSRVLDHSALEAIKDVVARYAALGKTLRLRRLSPDCYQLLAARNGAWSALVLEADADSDPIYEVAVDYSKKKGAIAPPRPPKPTTRDRPTGAGFGEAG